MGADMEVADDERRPTLGKDLGALGDRAVLTIPLLHGIQLTAFLVVCKPILAPQTGGGGSSMKSKMLDSKRALAEVDEFRSRFRGPIVARGDPDYEAVRKIWNAAIDKR